MNRKFVEKGSAVTALLSLLPLFLAFSMFLSLILIIISKHSELETKCNSRVLKTQHLLNQKLKSLRALNPHARSLRIKRKVAESRLKQAIASKYPPAITAATIYLAKVKVEQSQFKVQQNKILIEAQSVAEKMRTQWHYETRAHSVSGSQISLPDGPGLAIYPSPRTSLSPSYYLKKQFEQKQKVNISFDFNFPLEVPQWLKSVLPSKKLRIRINCAASLSQGLKPKITARRFLSWW